MILFVFSFAAADVPHDCAISAAMLAVVLLLKESMDADVDEKISHFYQQWLTEGIECAVCYFIIQLIFLQQYFPIPVPCNITQYRALGSIQPHYLNLPFCKHLHFPCAALLRV